MKDIGNWEFGSRNGAYTMNKHSRAISCVNSRCMTGRASVGEKEWVRCHVIVAGRVKKPWGELTRQDRKSRGRWCITSPDESLRDDVFQLICGECDGGSRECRSNSNRDLSLTHLETKYAKTDSKNGTRMKNWVRNTWVAKKVNSQPWKVNGQPCKVNTKSHQSTPRRSTINELMWRSDRVTCGRGRCLECVGAW